MQMVDFFIAGHILYIVCVTFMSFDLSLTKMDVCCAYGAVNAAHVQAALMCCTCASFCHTSYMRTCMLLVYVTCTTCTHASYRYAAHVPLTCIHITTVLRTCHLHTCKLLAFLICAACIHACYYSAAYMSLTHMQATSVPRMCSLHTCMLLQCLHTRCITFIMIFIYQ